MHTRLLILAIAACGLALLACEASAASAVPGVCRVGANLNLRGGYDDDGGGGGGYGGGYRGRGGGGYRGGYRGRGGFRGRGRGGRREPPADAPIDELKLYVGGLNWEVTSDGLKEHFEKFGECEAEVMIDKFSQRSRGFGFVTFQDAGAANAAKDAMDQTEIMGRVVAVNHARQKVEREAPANMGDGGGEDDGAME